MVIIRNLYDKPSLFVKPETYPFLSKTFGSKKQALYLRLFREKYVVFNEKMEFLELNSLCKHLNQK